MIVLSVGMQKAGSAWFFNLTNDLLVEAGHADARRIRERYGLEAIMTRANCNIDRPSALKLGRLFVPHRRGETFVVKTHEAPTLTSDFLARRGILRATYIYRDPRDVVVSLFDHGERIRREGIASSTGFDRFTTIELTIAFVAGLLPIWEAWTRPGRALVFRYEDLLANPIDEMQRLSTHLGLTTDGETLKSIVRRYQPQAEGSGIGKLHFHKGRAGRWRERLTPEQIEACERSFGDDLRRMGYEPA